MKSQQVTVLIVSLVLAILTAGMLLPLPWLARESLFEFTARMPKEKGVAAPDPLSFDFSFDRPAF